MADPIEGKKEIAKHEGNLTDDQVGDGDYPAGDWAGTYPVEDVRRLPQRKQRCSLPLEP